jgi:hypothetical protein
MHAKFDWEYVIATLKKGGEVMWPTPQPFTQNGEMCFICCSPFEMTHSQFLDGLKEESKIEDNGKRKQSRHVP